MTMYRGVVFDMYYPTRDNDETCDGFDTPKEAFEWAKKTAHSKMFLYIDYWAEDEDTDEPIEEYMGRVQPK